MNEVIKDTDFVIEIRRPSGIEHLTVIEVITKTPLSEEFSKDLFDLISKHMARKYNKFIKDSNNELR